MMGPGSFTLGLIGWPVSHSLSPVIHNAALEACGLEGEYRLFPIPPLPEGQEPLVDLVGRMRSGEIRGLNVTIPHKQNVMPLLDELTPSAEAIGAVNALVLRGKRLVGDNTDTAGFSADLQELGSFVEIDGRKALVLGAGGSARAVVYALLEDDWEVCVAARRPEQASALIASLQEKTGASPAGMSAIPLQAESLEMISSLSLIVNATPVGMTPDVHASPWPEELPFSPQASVYDLVYNPGETLLVKRARAAGLPARNGIGMLVGQATLAFESWTGCEAPLDAIWAALEASHAKPA